MKYVHTCRYVCVRVYIVAFKHIVMRDLFSYAISIFNSFVRYSPKCVNINACVCVVCAYAGVY